MQCLSLFRCPASLHTMIFDLVCDRVRGLQDKPCMLTVRLIRLLMANSRRLRLVWAFTANYEFSAILNRRYFKTATYSIDYSLSKVSSVIVSANMCDLTFPSSSMLACNILQFGLRPCGLFIRPAGLQDKPCMLTVRLLRLFMANSRRLRLVSVFIANSEFSAILNRHYFKTATYSIDYSLSKVSSGLCLRTCAT